MTRIHQARWIKPDNNAWKRHDIQPPLPVKRKGLLHHIIAAFNWSKRHD